MKNTRNLALVGAFILILGLSSTAHADELFTKNLYFGIQKDSEVTQLQEFLTSEGLYSGPITGNFFSLTLKAVKDFQTRESISPAAGYFGPLTRARANQILGAQVQGSNEQAVAETGTTPAPTPKTTTDVVSTMQSQLEVLLQQVALLQQQLLAQQQTQQSVQNLQTQVTQQTQTIQQQQQTIQQIQQNTAPQPPSPILIFSALPTSITSPGSSILSWSSTNADSCSASGVWSGEKNISGNESVSPSQSGTYFLTCSGAGGSVIKSVTISVSQPPPLAPTLTLTSLPTSLHIYGSSILSWSTTNASSCLASGAWSGTKSVSGNESVSPSKTSTYSLKCSGSGGSIVKSVTVSVYAPSVRIEAVSPTVAVNVGIGSGQTVGIFKIYNDGTAQIYLDTFQFANNGSATTTLGFKIYASTAGGSMSDTSGWNIGSGYLAATGTTGASSTISFNIAALTDAERLIDGGAWRYLTVKTTGVAANNDTFQFFVRAYGDIKFSVKEVDLGYSGNGDGDLDDTIYGLYVDMNGIPTCGSVTAKT
ncbi:MAG: peptidoglycan-binding domain-containing protein [Candidatus Jorgensenbacteria bacterium]